MELHTIPGCCSMMLISDNPSPKIKVEDFKKLLKYNLVEKGISGERIKTLVMITNIKFFGRLKYKKFGFRKAYSYRGNISGNIKAHVMYLNFKKSLLNYIYS
ncbi:MAG: hypothetical protein ACEQSQ_06105 [Candidatus Paceibacteria bacterium]